MVKNGQGPGPEGRKNDIITCNQQNLDERERENWKTEIFYTVTIINNTQGTHA